MTQENKAIQFEKLHKRPGVFLIPNPWDSGSARILTGLGFEALATSSAGSAAALGARDGKLTREQALAHAREVVNATTLPVSGDLEDGFGQSPEAAAHNGHADNRRTEQLSTRT